MIKLFILLVQTLAMSTLSSCKSDIAVVDSADDTYDERKTGSIIGRLYAIPYLHDEMWADSIIVNLVDENGVYKTLTTTDETFQFFGLNEGKYDVYCRRPIQKVGDVTYNGKIRVKAGYTTWIYATYAQGAGIQENIDWCQIILSNSNSLKRSQVKISSNLPSMEDTCSISYHIEDHFTMDYTPPTVRKENITEEAFSNIIQMPIGLYHVRVWFECDAVYYSDLIVSVPLLFQDTIEIEIKKFNRIKPELIIPRIHSHREYRILTTCK